MKTDSKSDLYRQLPSVDEVIRASELADLVARGDITVPVAAVYDFTSEQVRKAYRDVGTRHVSGKRVLRIMPANNQFRHA